MCLVLRWYAGCFARVIEPILSPYNIKVSGGANSSSDNTSLMNRPSRAAWNRAIYSASHELAATKDCFPERHDTRALALLSLKVYPDIDWKSISLAQSLSEYPSILRGSLVL